MELQYRQRRLTEQDKKCIIQDYKSGVKIKDIMKEHNVRSSSTIYAVIRPLMERVKEPWIK